MSLQTSTSIISILNHLILIANCKLRCILDNWRFDFFSKAFICPDLFSCTLHTIYCWIKTTDHQVRDFSFCDCTVHSFIFRVWALENRHNLTKGLILSFVELSQNALIWIVRLLDDEYILQFIHKKGKYIE